MTRKKLLMLALLSVAPSLAMATEQDSCERAEQARAQAAELQYEWTTIAPLLKQAETARAKGDHDSANRLCEEARQQARLAIAQAEREAAAWQDAAPW